MKKLNKKLGNVLTTFFLKKALKTDNPQKSLTLDITYNVKVFEVMFQTFY